MCDHQNHCLLLSDDDNKHKEHMSTAWIDTISKARTPISNAASLPISIQYFHWCSLLLTKDELLRPENDYDRFSTITSRAMKKIASFEDASIADVLAVCGAVAIEVASKGRNKVLGVGGKNMRVGRLDSITPAPENQLLPGDAPTSDFAEFWVKHR
jgi:hypothetical protein